MKKYDMMVKMVQDIAFYMGNMNYATLGYATDNKSFYQNAVHAFYALRSFCDDIGWIVTPCCIEIFGKDYFAGVMLMEKNKPQSKLFRWCTSCNENVDACTFKAFSEFVELNKN